MDIQNYVREEVFAAIGDASCDPDRVIAGVDAYTEDNGFMALAGDFDDSVIRQVIRTDLEGHRLAPGKETALYFANYRLIERVQVVNNRSLTLSLENGTADPEAVSDIEKEFDECMREISREDGLYDMLEVQISEIVLNLERARKGTGGMSRRSRDTEVLG